MRLPCGICTHWNARPSRLCDNAASMCLSASSRPSGRQIEYGRNRQMNAIKDAIKSGKTVVGTAGSPNADVSLLADAGFDFLLFDTQHSPWEIKQLQPPIQAMRGKQMAPVVRVATNEAYQICFALDAGARGIVVPMVNTRAEAEAAVRACRYYPLGNRSNAGVRGEWGEFKNYRDYLDAVNNELLIVPMIETNQALENLDAIASVPGVDVLLIGPSDLSIELGVPLDYQCDIYQRALDKIAATAAKHGITAAMYFIPPEMDPNFFVQKGFRFFTMPWGPWAKAGIQNGLTGIKRQRRWSDGKFNEECYQSALAKIADR